MTPDQAPNHSARTATVGWLEVALPIWHRRLRVMATGVAGAIVGFGLAALQPVEYSAKSSFIVRSALASTPSGAGLASMPSLAGIIGIGSPIDLHLAILRSDAISERILERFSLQAAWQMPSRRKALSRLRSQVSFAAGKRDGLVTVTVMDENPLRAAAMANEYVNELRMRLKYFARQEAGQRREFLDAQVAALRKELSTSQKAVRTTGMDTGALRSDAKATAEAYARLQASIASLELQLATARRVRAEGSQEVQQLVTELSTLKSQQAQLARPSPSDGGELVDRARDLRFTEAMVEALTRQAQTARTDEASEPLPFQLLDEARPTETPASPFVIYWVILGMLAGMLAQCQWVLMRHRSALALLDSARQARLKLLREVIAGQHRTNGRGGTKPALVRSSPDTPLSCTESGQQQA